MNRFVRLVKENVVPSIVLAILVVSCAAVWYFLHPSSPYHPRYSFVVSFQEVGTLSPGNKVEIRGISVGQISKVELTEDAVFVTATVYAKNKIPINSQFRLINSGLMGEREMCILTGDAQTLISDGDTLYGLYDAGASGVFKNLKVAFGTLGEIRDSLGIVVDSLKDGSTGKRMERIAEKGKKIVRVGKSGMKSWASGMESLLDELDQSLTKVKATLDDLSGRTGSKVDEAKPLLDRVVNALEQVKALKAKFGDLMDRIPSENGTVAKVFDEKGMFAKELERTLKSIDALIADIKKIGLKMNVDIF